MADADPFCPRHGRARRPKLSPGLRCDCSEVIEQFVGALKRGKWVLGRALPNRGAAPVVVGETERFAIEDRVGEAVREALLVGYELGLRGGVHPDLVYDCPKCGKPYVFTLSCDDFPGGPCPRCYVEANP